jgi:hypothetical protein
MARRIWLVMLVCATMLTTGTMVLAQGRNDPNRSDPKRSDPKPIWELLGETRVGFAVARDVVSVGQSYSFYRNRSYDRLRLTADRGEVKLQSLLVRYINGYEEKLPLDKSVRPGASVIVELPGRRSYVAQIEMTYNAVGGNTFGGVFDQWLQPRVRVFGLNSRIGLSQVEADTPPNWTMLGQDTVSFTGTGHVIRLANDEVWYDSHRFKRLRFIVSEGKVQLHDLRIVYINDFTETVLVGRDLRQGTDLAVELPGERSYVREIQLNYRTWPGSPKRAIVKVYGEGPSQ